MGGDSKSNFFGKDKSKILQIVEQPRSIYLGKHPKGVIMKKGDNSLRNQLKKNVMSNDNLLESSKVGLSFFHTKFRTTQVSNSSVDTQRCNSYSRTRKARWPPTTTTARCTATAQFQEAVCCAREDPLSVQTLVKQLAFFYWMIVIQWYKTSTATTPDTYSSSTNCRKVS